MNYEIFTDSSSGLPLEVTSRYDIKIIPLTLITAGEETKIRPDDEEFLKKFYARLREKADMSTACVNRQEFENYFRPALESGKDVLYIGLSSGLSQTCDNARFVADKLKNEFPNRHIYTLDSMNASLGEGLLTYLACVKREEGLPASEVYNYLTAIRMNANSLFTVKTLSYLARGGRISKLTMTVGTVVDVKPIMYVNEFGKLVSSSKVIGRKRSIVQIAENFAKTMINPEEQTIFIGHGDCIDDALLLAKLIKERVPVKEFIFNYIDPIIAVHSGPDTLAVFGYGNSRIPSESFQVNSVDFASENL